MMWSCESIFSFDNKRVTIASSLSPSLHIILIQLKKTKMREKPCKKDPKKVLSHQSDSFLEGWTPSFSHLVFSWFWDRLKSQTGWDWLIVKASYSLHPHLHQPQWGLMDGEAAVIWWPSVTRCSKRTNRPKTRQQLEPTDPPHPQPYSAVVLKLWSRSHWWDRTTAGGWWG